MKKSILFLLLFLLSLSTQAQTDSTESKSKRYHEIDWDDFDDWSFDSDIFDWNNDRPIIEMNFGILNLEHSNSLSSFNKIGSAELKLGYSSFYDCSNPVAEMDDKYFLFSYANQDLYNKDFSDEKLNINLWKVGFGNRTGYGYKTSSVSIFFFDQNDFLLSSVEGKNLDAITNLSDRQLIERFQGSVRLTDSREGGVSVQFGNSISLTGSYEATVIFPRYLFWKQFGSYLVDRAGYYAIDNFVDVIMESSPNAAPIVNFLLKNAYNYGFFLLKKEDMNWPFSTESPLSYETFKVGVTFTF